MGGLAFGHYGDKIGRRKLLVLSLLMTGLSTFAISLLHRLPARLGVRRWSGPVFAVALLTATGTGYAIAFYVAAGSLLTIVAVAGYSETRTRRLDRDDALGHRARAVGGRRSGTEPERSAGDAAAPSPSRRRAKRRHGR